MGFDFKAAKDIFLEEIVMLKWRLLVVACFVPFGSYYVYDFPGSIGMGHTGSIQAQFFLKGKDFNNEMNQALYSVYSWPNTVLAVFGGLLIDKYLGLRVAMLLFSFLVMSGAFLFYGGVCVANYPLMVIGRAIFGLGGESLTVAQSSLTARWFRNGRGLALAMGITVSFSRVGSSVNFFLSPPIAETWGVEYAALAGALACAFSFLSVICVIFIDTLGVKRGVVPPQSKDANAAMNLKDAFRLPSNFWLVSTICVFVYCSIFPFISIAKGFFEVKYDLDGDKAASYAGLYQITSAAGSPIVGGLVDGAGRFTQFMGGSSIAFMFIHLILLFTKAPPFVMMPVLGVAYSFLVSSLWPCVPYAVPETLCGLSYGILTAMQNAGLAILPLISGAILDQYTPPMPSIGLPNCSDPLPPTMAAWPPMTRINCTNATAPLPYQKGFDYTLILFCLCALCSLIFSVILYFNDKKKTGGKLSSSPSDRNALTAAEEKLLSNDDQHHAKHVDEINGGTAEEPPNGANSANSLAEKKGGYQTDTV